MTVNRLPSSSKLLQGPKMSVEGAEYRISLKVHYN